MDDGDRSQRSEMFLTSVGINQARAALPGDDAICAPYCSNCGTEIPDERRKAQPGCVLCAPCKSAIEQRQR